MRLLATSILLSVTAVALVSTAPAAEPNKYNLKPGAKGKICLSCHVDFEETLKKASVHTPVRAGDCSDCHNPHASSHGKLLAADPNKICFECHSDISPAGAKSVHQAVMEGNCVTCHDPHAAANKNNLLKAGNDLCFGCHKDLATSIQTAQFKHNPVEKGCLGCHDPHASVDSVALLKKAMPDTCTGCHKPDQPAFVKQHMGYPVGASDCTSCHDPHGSSNAGILWASAHPPVMNRMCGQCHEDATSANALQTKKAGIDLCRGCHSEVVNETFANNRIHWPVVDKKACLSCHSPHASRTAKLLGAPQKKLCGTCHRDAVERQAKSMTKHPPIDDGDCSMCHAPHSANAVFLLNDANVNNLCGTCHDWQRHSSHPIGEKVEDPRNKNLTLDCLSCHRSHGTPFKAFSNFDPKMDLCVQCHVDMQR